MRRLPVILFCFACIALFSFSFNSDENGYATCYARLVADFSEKQEYLLQEIRKADVTSDADKQRLKQQIAATRLKLKEIDIWLRYLEPIGYKRINGPLPVEWETEVFEKWEKPYKREGAGLTLAELYLEEENINRDTLARLMERAVDAAKIFQADSVTRHLKTADHFFFANRMFLLNLAAIYTTGFECPNTDNVIPELRHMLAAVKTIYACFDNSFSKTSFTPEYLALYDKMIEFAKTQPANFEEFNHFLFIRDYVNPLFALNQQMIGSYGMVSASYNDYSLNNSSRSIFSKSLYRMQHPKGDYSLVEDAATLQEIDRVGKLLFYDPILSANNMRSCASCHVPTQFFTDTTVKTAFHFDHRQRLPRNTPSLVNVVYNHLLMLDGKHLSLQAQAKDVTSNAIEMGGSEKEFVDKVMSCKEYKTAFKRLLKYTPGETEVSARHLLSAVTFYYSKFSDYYAPFDDAMNGRAQLDDKAIRGFNLFMSKAECATCHFVPLFNGVKPPYVGSEFEVIGVPVDSAYTALSPDSGRYKINPAPETLHGFRTTTVKNIEHTKPYMHNGVFNTLDEVLEFYNGGGGQGRGFDVSNQTLSGDSLHLTKEDKEALLAFFHALNEKVVFENPPAQLPASSDAALNKRKVAGEY